MTVTNASGLNILVLVGDWAEDLQLDDRIIDWVRHINGASRPVMSTCHGTQVLRRHPPRTTLHRSSLLPTSSPILPEPYGNPPI